MSARKHLASSIAVLSIAPLLYVGFLWLTAHGDCGYCGYIGFSLGIAASLVVGGIWLAYSVVRIAVGRRRGKDDANSS